MSGDTHDEHNAAGSDSEAAPGESDSESPTEDSSTESTLRRSDPKASEKCKGRDQASKCKCCPGVSTCDCCSTLSCKLRSQLERHVREDTASWRAPAFSSYAYLRDELKRLESQTSAEDAARESTIKSAKRTLDEALMAMTPAHQLRRGSKRWGLSMPRPLIALKRFYSGSDVEQAWRALHRVQAALYTMYLPEELTPQAEHVEAVIAELPEQAALLKAATKLASEIDGEANHKANANGESPSVTKPGTMLRGIYERAMDVSDNLQREARGLRNALVVASFVTLVLLLALGVAHAIDKSIIELCAPKTSSTSMACPIDGKPHPFDVFAVELAGMLGGLLSIIIPLATGERIKTPYRVFNQQLVFKLLAAAASAIGGVLLIESGVIETIKLDSTTAILGYAVVLGFAQQIATGAIDRTADSLAKQTPTAKSV